MNYQERRPSTVEMTDGGNRGKPKSGFPLFPPSLEIAKNAIPTFPQRRRFLYLPIHRAEITRPCGRTKNTTANTIKRSKSERQCLCPSRRFRPSPHWNQRGLSGPSRIGIYFLFQAHLRIGKCWPLLLPSHTQTEAANGFDHTCEFFFATNRGFALPDPFAFIPASISRPVETRYARKNGR